MRFTAFFLLLGLAAATRQHYTITSSSDPPKELGGQMFFINDNGECLETNLDKKYRNGARSMIEDLIEGSCASEGYELFKSEIKSELGKPYWLGEKPVPLTFSVNVPTERTLRKWAREDAMVEQKEAEMKKQYEEQLARLPAEGRAALEKMDKGETLTDQDKKALEAIEKSEMDRMQSAQQKFRQAGEESKPSTDGKKAGKKDKKGDSPERAARKKERQARRAARHAAKKAALKKVKGDEKA